MTPEQREIGSFQTWWTQVQGCQRSVQARKIRSGLATAAMLITMLMTALAANPAIAKIPDGTAVGAKTKPQADLSPSEAAASDISLNIFKAMMELPNEEWAKDKIFMAAFAKTDGSEEALLVTKRRFALAAARAMEASPNAASAQANAVVSEPNATPTPSEGMSIEKARKIIPALAGLDDDQAFEVIHSKFYPTWDKAYLAKQLNYKTQSSNVQTQEWFIPIKNVGTIVFWILFVGGVMGYFRAKKRHQQSKDYSSKSANPLLGIHGWLAFFVVCLGVFGPALNLGSVAGTFHDAEKASAYLASTPAWKTYQNAVWITLAAASAFSIFAAIQMRFNWTPPTVTLAKVAVASWPVVSLLIGIVIPNLVLSGHVRSVNFDFAGAFFSSLASSIIWITFLSKSERVRATYVSRL